MGANYKTTWTGIAAGISSFLAAASTISATQEGQTVIAFLSPQTKVKVAIGSAVVAMAFKFWNSLLQKDRDVSGGARQQDAAGDEARPQEPVPAPPNPALPR